MCTSQAPFTFIVFLSLCVCVCVWTAPPQPPTGQYNMVGTPAMAGTGSVLMIYGLAQGKFNCDHIFNLLCSYGNVLKVCLLSEVSTVIVLLHTSCPDMRSDRCITVKKFMLTQQFVLV